MGLKKLFKKKPNVELIMALNESRNGGGGGGGGGACAGSGGGETDEIHEYHNEGDRNFENGPKIRSRPNGHAGHSNSNNNSNHNLELSLVKRHARNTRDHTHDAHGGGGGGKRLEKQGKQGKQGPHGSGHTNSNASSNSNAIAKYPGQADLSSAETFDDDDDAYKRYLIICQGVLQILHCFTATPIRQGNGNGNNNNNGNNSGNNHDNGINNDNGHGDGSGHGSEYQTSNSNHSPNTQADTLKTPLSRATIVLGIRLGLCFMTMLSYPLIGSLLFM